VASAGGGAAYPGGVRKPASALAKLVGWLLVLAVPYVLVGTLFAPRAVQVLNPVACRSGGHLTNRGPVSAGSDATSSSIEMACRGGGRIDNVLLRIVLIIAGLLVAAAICFTAASRLHNERPRGYSPVARR